jgi:tRNA nucleotidyltransferase (CCA-adding enzyme)
MKNIPKEIKIALDMLTQNHYEAYIVGGAVRDYLLKQNPSDYDITTSATPEEIMEIFQGYQMLDQGLKHGTVMVIINHKMVEITTFRIDEDYLDNRHPSKVTFTRSLREDLARRDFTINALAYHHEVIDYFHGQEDLQNKLIRAVGDPNQRFTEDALRILRAIRFSCQLNFDIEEKTKAAIFAHKALLANISVERIVLELNKMLMHYTKRMAPFYEIFKVFIPDLTEELLHKNLRYLEKSENNLVVRLALFLNDVKNIDMILKRLKYPLSTQKAVQIILNNKNTTLVNEKIAWKKLLKMMRYDDIINLIQFKKAQGEIVDDDLLTQAKDECYQIKDLAINGYDLMALGIPNKSRNVVFNHILDLIIEEKLENNKDKIIDYLKTNSLNLL